MSRIERNPKPDRLEDLMPLLDDPAPAVRGRTAQRIGALGESAAPAVPKLYSAIRDKIYYRYPDVCLMPRYHPAAEALAGIGKPAHAIALELVNASDCELVLNGVVFIQTTGVPLHETVPRLIEIARSVFSGAHVAGCASNCSPQVLSALQFHCLLAVKRMGDAADAIVPALQEFVARPRPNLTLAEVLPRIRVTPRLLDEIYSVIEDESLSSLIRVKFAIALAGMQGGDSKRIAKSMRSILTNGRASEGALRDAQSVLDFYKQVGDET